MFSRAFEKYLREEKLAGSMGRNDMTDSTGTPLYSQFPLSRQSSRAKHIIDKPTLSSHRRGMAADRLIPTEER